MRRDKLPACLSCRAQASRCAAHSLDSLCTDSSSARPRRACAGDARRNLRLLPPAPAQVCRRRPSAADSSGAPPATARACRYAARHMPAQPRSAATPWLSAPPYKCCPVQSNQPLPRPCNRSCAATLFIVHSPGQPGVRAQAPFPHQAGLVSRVEASRIAISSSLLSLSAARRTTRSAASL